MSEAIATRLIGAFTEPSGLCAMACENMSEVVKSVELDEGTRDGREFLGFTWWVWNTMASGQGKVFSALPVERSAIISGAALLPVGIL